MFVLAWGWVKTKKKKWPTEQSKAEPALLNSILRIKASDQGGKSGLGGETGRSVAQGAILMLEPANACPPVSEPAKELEQLFNKPLNVEP
ncbi:hypothetical protein HYFRA_00009530 [Hymenoscyphus fraxineus]|uniref:Uncharacterized protein n=1 Tax=Hymenoscyphus fraxineus TaxID=746836 RepID=A0A9N9KYV8_9HELO|nr:hypothetical protein HYFRA_00009530 [Hymenoscyphus fraxineus]